MAIDVFINGKRDQLDGPLGLAELLESKKIRPEVSTVMLNREAVRRENLASTTASDGDVVEIMIQLAGGSDAARRSEGARRSDA